jgi:hypothetical protein
MENNTQRKDELIETFCNFLVEIGIEVLEDTIPGTTFLPGLEIRNGKLFYDRGRLLYPGDLLHEAGHIAVSSQAERDGLNENITDNNPDKSGEELAVMLWTYAVCKKIGLDPEVIFHPNGYKGNSTWILENYASGNFIGLPLLVWMQMTKDAGLPDGYPQMQKWLRE